MSQEVTPQEAEVAVRNIGGIDKCHVSLEEGVTILSGRNATNRTSLLTAIAGALGGTHANIKTDRQEGTVTLTLGNESYTRRYENQNGDVTVGGDPYCEDADIVDLFVTQLEHNPARRAVERGDDLRELIMEPVDTEAIESELQNLLRKRDRNEERITEVNRSLDRVPSLESRREELETELEEIEETLTELQKSIAEYDSESAQVEEAKEAIDEFEHLREELESKQKEIETQRSSIDALREEYDDIESKLVSLEVPEEDLTEIENQRSSLKKNERNLAETVDTLSAIVEFNDNLLNEEGSGTGENALDLSIEDDVTSELNPTSKTIECWTCGNEVERSDISQKLNELRDVLDNKRTERNEIQNHLEKLQRQANEVRSTTDEIEELKERKAKIEEEITEREEKISTLQEEADDIRDQIAEVRDQIEETDELRENNVIEKHQNLAKYEYKKGQLEQELCELTNELEDMEELKEEREQLKGQQTEIKDEIESLRSRIESLETDLVESFNEHMADVLSLLVYENIERIWIERKVTADNNTTLEAKRDSEFHLHIVRKTEDGKVYEDSVDTLSESEREVIGLVVSLTGYLVHDIHDSVPVMLLDSLEAIDSQRIADLIDYFSEYVPFLVVALLPEDEQAVDDKYDRIPAERLGSMPTT